MPVVFDRAGLERVIQALADDVGGEWLLVGGGAVALWLDDTRVTEDVDLVGLRGTAEDRLALMDLAAALGLPIESVNSAADWFVYRIQGWREELAVLRKGARGTVFRPTPTLFLLLKLGRLSGRDLEDCRLAITRAHAAGDAIDIGRVLEALDARPPPGDEAAAERRATLRSLVSEIR